MLLLKFCTILFSSNLPGSSRPHFILQELEESFILSLYDSYLITLILLMLCCSFKEIVFYIKQNLLMLLRVLQIFVKLLFRIAKIIYRSTLLAQDSAKFLLVFNIALGTKLVLSSVKIIIYLRHPRCLSEYSFMSLTPDLRFGVIL